MADNLPPRTTAAAAPGVDERRDWPAEATALVVRVVDQAKAKTTRPAMLVARGIVYGLIAGLVGITIAVLLFIGLFRAVDILRELVVEDAVWLTYLVLGLVFTIAGAIVFSRRKFRT
jgi:hypothetical protein